MLKSGSLVIAIVASLCLCASSHADDKPALPAQESASGITHSFLAMGAETYIMGADGKVQWTYPKGTRDGFVLPSGNLLLALSKSKEYPGGAAVEITREGKMLFEYKGTQSEVNTVQAVGDGRYMLTE